MNKPQEYKIQVHVCGKHCSFKEYVGNKQYNLKHAVSFTRNINNHFKAYK